MNIKEHYDIAVVGAGPGGYSVALRASQLGKSVLLVDRRPTPGGVCLHEGCIPSRALLRVADTVRRAKRAADLGFFRKDAVAGITRSDAIDMEKTNAYKQGIVDAMISGLGGVLASRGVRYVQAEARVMKPGTVELHPAGGEQGPDALDEPVEIRAEDIVLATGSHANELESVPVSHRRILDSTDALDLGLVPSSALILGSGDVALEFAGIWAPLGTRVTLVERGERILRSATKRVSATVSRNLRQAGVALVTQAQILSASEDENTATLRYRDADGQVRSLSADVLLPAVGRIPNTGMDWLADLGVALGADPGEQGRILTDAVGRTNVPGIWAVGDVTPGKQLAHRAYAQGLVIAETIAGVETTPLDDRTVPATTYGLAENCSVGYTADEARADARFADVAEDSYPMAGNACTAMTGQAGIVTLVSGRLVPDRGGDDTGHANTNAYGARAGERVLLGAQMAGPQTTDLAAEAEELIGNRIPIHDAARLVHPHPTVSEALGEALLLADGRPLHAR